MIHRFYSQRNFFAAQSVLCGESQQFQSTKHQRSNTMNSLMNRRDLLKLAGMGAAVFVSGKTARAGGAGQMKDESFYFVQLSDTHWGFNGSSINPDSQGTLKKAVAAVNGLDEQPDFIIFTGDLTQTTD